MVVAYTFFLNTLIGVSLCIIKITSKGHLNITDRDLLANFSDGKCVDFFLIVNIGSAHSYLYFYLYTILGTKIV